MVISGNRKKMLQYFVFIYVLCEISSYGQQIALGIQQPYHVYRILCVLTCKVQGRQSSGEKWYRKK